MATQFKKLNLINKDPLFREFREKNLKLMLTVATLIGVYIIMGFYYLDVIKHFSNLRTLLLFRSIFCLIFLLNLGVTLLHKNRNHSRFHVYVGFYLCAVYCSVQSVLTGGMDSPYWVGLSLTIMVWFIFVPFPYLNLIINGCIFLAQYFLIVFIFENDPVTWNSLVEVNFYIKGFLIIGAIISIINNNSSFQIYEKLKSLEESEQKYKNLENELAKSHEMLKQNYSHTLEQVQNFSEEIKIKQNELLRLQKDNLQSQFETLKNQVNPHFLFNSLNVLNSLISVDPELAEKFTGQLSKIYRYVLEHRSEDMVPLKAELDFLHSYVFLMNIRFDGKLKVNIQLPDDKLEKKLPPLSMQLLIENAIKHNTFSTRSPLIIDIFVDKEDHLHVENNYQAREKHIKTTSLGLRNISDRYAYYTDLELFFGVVEDRFVACIPLL
ncbi:MAG: histidine kinase [Bacteroidetes bacterium]|nr:histidine kinase [Bacteroidota bacterium]